MTETLITVAPEMAFELREIKPDLIIHSDRSVQYRSHKYIDFMKSKGCRPSMSRKVNCWDNAPMKLFCSRLKVELIYAEQYETIDEAKSGIFEYIEVFYNKLWQHWAIGYISLVAFEEDATVAA